MSVEEQSHPREFRDVSFFTIHNLVVCCASASFVVDQVYISVLLDFIEIAASDIFQNSN